MLALSALALVTAASAAVATPSQPKGLDALAKRLKPARYVGTATESYNLQNATAFGRKYASIAESDEFGIYTPENTLKW
ncbi:hypothetical protein FRC08_008767 [Ceratobasidium sp. 394]|nr:hypothetical protein FRC08_008767 [Ceratobasidium sp. 394]